MAGTVASSRRDTRVITRPIMSFGGRHDLRPHHHRHRGTGGARQIAHGRWRYPRGRAHRRGGGSNRRPPRCSYISHPPQPPPSGCARRRERDGEPRTRRRRLSGCIMTCVQCDGAVRPSHELTMGWFPSLRWCSVTCWTAWRKAHYNGALCHNPGCRCAHPSTCCERFEGYSLLPDARCPRCGWDQFVHRFAGSNVNGSQEVMG